MDQECYSYLDSRSSSTFPRAERGTLGLLPRPKPCPLPKEGHTEGHTFRNVNTTAPRKELGSRAGAVSFMEMVPFAPERPSEPHARS